MRYAAFLMLAAACSTACSSGNGNGSTTSSKASSGGTAGSSTGGGGGCGLQGDDCTSQACCAGVCNQGTCACTPESQSCQQNNQCCSGNCISGLCGPCNQVSSLCSENANCCEGDCNGGVCAQPACSPVGASCGHGGCCAGSGCVQGVCACTGLGDVPTATVPCCPGMTEAPTSSSTFICISEMGGQCTTSAECTTQACDAGTCACNAHGLTPNRCAQGNCCGTDLCGFQYSQASGDLSACVSPVGSACQSATDCSSYTCTNRVCACVTPTQGVSPACTQQSDCCSGTCTGNAPSAYCVL